MLFLNWNQILNKEKQSRPPSRNKERRGIKTTKSLSPRNGKACHNTSTALLQRIVKIRAQSIVKSNIDTLRELSPHIPQKLSKAKRSRSTNKLIHADINATTQ
jgi:hypothetical protein